jgi:D-tyrosyl-tRNA(Tyr) deacylase
VRVLLQRVAVAEVTVRGEKLASIGPGLLLLVASGNDDRADDAERLASKIWNLRIFEDGSGKMNISAAGRGAEILVVPQFTLYADVKRGRRPSWANASPPDVALERVEALATALERLGAKVGRGAFREHMEISLVNDGPVTMWLDASKDL